MSIRVTGFKGVLLGLAIGLGFGFRASRGMEAPFNTLSFACFGTILGGAMGAAAGCILWWIDTRREPVPPENWLPMFLDANNVKKKDEGQDV